MNDFNFINKFYINNNIANNNNISYLEIIKILNKGALAKGLNDKEISALINITDDNILNDLLAVAAEIKEKIYGKRIVLFAPLYLSNHCSNNCVYCGFQANNKEIKRVKLDEKGIISEVNQLINSGHKRLLVVSGEELGKKYLNYIINSIKTIYDVKSNENSIRRVNVNIAPLTIDEFIKLKESNIGTYQLFQETYHEETYKLMHISGKKSNYIWRLMGIDRAIMGGISDVGIGALLGLYDWRFELLSLIAHSKYLFDKFGIGPHTISVPRLETASGSEISKNPPYKVNDKDFCKLVAILRIAVPYTGIILSTRESEKMRTLLIKHGVSQISAGSKTSPGGYNLGEPSDGQFDISDKRNLDEVVYGLLKSGQIPSFCTSCYRLNRIGKKFMTLSKSGKIKNKCFLNAILTLYEYLNDYSSEKTKNLGDKLIKKEIEKTKNKEIAVILKNKLELIKNGAHDITF